MATNNYDSMTRYISEGNPVDTTFTSPEGDLKNVGVTQYPHVFIGLTFTNNNGVPTTPGAGTYTVTVETLNNPGVFQSITNGSGVSAVDPATLSVAANITRIKVEFTGITGATKFNLVVTANRS